MCIRDSVLTGHYSENFFNDKIVLVGATAAGMGDALPTPVSALSQPMSGVEFHANTIAAMRSARLIRNAPLWFSALICVILAVIPLLFLPKLSPLKSLLLMGVYYCAVTVAAVATPQFLNIWIPPAGALVAILLTYPIWSWRKLESAKVYLDSALQNLQAELAQLGMDKTNLDGIKHQDAMQSRIAKVELTSQYLRDSQQKRVDTLAFISHDIRAPLAAAMMLLNENENESKAQHSDRVSQMLNRALNMADEFLQSSRAEMADFTKFTDIEMGGLCQEAVDDVYGVAQAQNIKVEINAIDESLWVKGDFGLLQRAILNLLSNAVKYSPEQSTVNVQLKKVDQTAILQIADTGHGIPPEKLAKLFKRFSRVEGEYQLPVGTGLGLYFVDITIKKHGGSIVVDSVVNVGSTFTIKLPLLDAAAGV